MQYNVIRLNISIFSPFTNHQSLPDILRKNNKHVLRRTLTDAASIQLKSTVSFFFFYDRRTRTTQRYTYIHIYIYYIYLSIIVQREYCSSDTTFNRVIEKWNKIKNLRGCEKLVRTRDCVNMFGSERKRKK